MLEPAAAPADRFVGFGRHDGLDAPIGNPGNACDPQSQGCFGAVGYDYSIGTYEVTNAQYAEFLNAKATRDPLGLYNTSMGEFFGGITRTVHPGA